MPATSYISCGCSTTCSMFGKREILSVSPCPEHALELQPELKALQEKMFNLLHKTNNNGKENKEERRSS